ncbi:WD repeat-containing protein 38-like [Daphnia pulex]|uniref:WD repeat-containing protein 38-like n=1 Tax=Daphnia pulex TaxID=6669 RepID=UPI001EDCDD26|nr:WD repeat-containing protein 38-like [Daphnia pulex]
MKSQGKIVVWTPLENEKTKILKQHPRSVEWLSFSPDGRFLASTDFDRNLIIWATENWQPVYIGEEYIRGGHFSWLSSSSTDAPDYKLTFNSSGGRVPVVEYAVGQSVISSKDE